MITAGFLTENDGTLLGFTVQGHSELGDPGTDVLCAAVSSAVYLVINTVTDVLHVTPLALRAQEGDVLFRVEGRDADVCQTVMQGLKLHLSDLEEQYPEHLRVSYVNVDFP